MNQEAKKRKAVTSAKAKAVPATVGEAWELMKKGTMRIFKSMAEYVEDLVKTNGDAGEIMASVYYRSADMECKFYVPPEFQTFQVKRNDVGQITEIADAGGNAIQGQALGRMLTVASMKDKGVGKLILGEMNDGRIEALAIPKSLQFEEISDAKKKNFHTGVRALYSHRARTTVYASNEKLTELLGLGYVGVADAGNLAKSLNSMASKEGLIDFDIKSFSDIATLQSALGDTSVKLARKSFFQTLLAAGIKAMNMEQRVNHFQMNPSYTLANNLEFSLPHTGPLFLKLGNKPATAVSLSSVAEDTDILMSNHVLSYKEYSEIAGDVVNYPVYVNSENVGGRKGPRFAEMHHKKLEKAGRVAKMLASISADNEGKKLTAKPKETSTASTAAVTYIDLE